jgi:hypothetical protein
MYKAPTKKIDTWFHYFNIIAASTVRHIKDKRPIYLFHIKAKKATFPTIENNQRIISSIPAISLF